ncbi:MAG: hypothetical protein JWS12_859 [Candidatus Saccharibacteria bacterium]|nr:hypothetical protein [Candidatus Saccharibacteria bacterium]
MENDNRSVRQQIVDRVKEASNVLVTVSANPSVDQLAACIGMTLMLNKMGKHATAVFSGKVPSTIEFLQPEKTLEKNTNSLRDFIIALDKSKADKLRYKVEDKLVKIFITPYRTSISDKDLEFSQGDFNVDVVLAIGVQKREDLDQAIIAHGRILHDATVVSVNKTATDALGSLNWQEPNSSSLSEMVAGLSDDLQPNLLDGQMATALLTGIVAETERFRNSKTTPQTMAISAKLMAAGANQQLVASKLDKQRDISDSGEAPGAVNQGDKPKAPGDDGSLSIDHGAGGPKEKDASENPSEDTAPPEKSLSQIRIDEHGQLSPLPSSPEDKKKSEDSGGLMLDPPRLGGTLTASGQPDDLDPMSLPPLQPPILSRSPNEPPKITDDETLVEIEKSIHSPHVAQEEQAAAAEPQGEVLDEARDAVQEAIQSSPPAQLEPIESLGAQPVDLDLLGNTPAPPPNAMPGGATSDNPFNLPSNLVPPSTGLPPAQTGTSAPATPPPPVPPPILPSQYIPPAITPTLPTAEEFEQQHEQDGNQPN